MLIKRKTIEYAIYKGDKFIDIGTAKELAEKRNVKPETIEFYASPSYLKRLEKVKDKYNKGFVCVRLT